jgi:hypothetical protein
MSNAYFFKLATIVDEILEGLRTNPIGRDWPVNWGDLHCARIEETRQMYPHEQLKNCTIYIEEADPSCHELQRYVENALYERKYNVTVETEW